MFKWPNPSDRIQQHWGLFSLTQEWVQRDLFGGKVQPARKADNFAVTVVQNVKISMEAQHSIRPLSLHDLLRESFIYT